MATVLDLATDSLLELGVLAAGETAAAGDGAFALRALNRMVNAWKAERVFIYQTTRTEWTISANNGSYTVGSGGNVNILRPVKIDGISILETSATPDYETPLRIMTDADYRAITSKAQTSDQPEAAWYNLTYPLATIELWPVPTSATLRGVLYAPQAVDEFAAITTTVSLPPAYERMIVKNLALELAPAYRAEVSPLLLEQARDSLAVVLRANRRLVDMTFDPGAAMHGASYDILSDVP